MDELKDKITEEELEEATGGVEFVSWYFCDKCKRIVPENEILFYDPEISPASRGRIHKYCGGLVSIISGGKGQL